ncbi:penicillin acylase family protein [Mucilaginibacter sp. RS28]|uniref:Penicillin acylase family protein n=1 Tax=Mucilaginibacter straminoryzae TaxID=2932774 RepID=A0A9X2B8A9_9SPHI|nr:penicillin acylase family protein [Mucilaginibacter straminoryzae]MCJ8209281.1 penicillin acylase family protein [Mucilaginibacter straminoryzae]
MKAIKALLSIVFTLALIWALQHKFGSLPPIGKFLNPCNGFWQNAESKHILKEENLNIEGLQKPVIIRFDENMIPHIFAQNDHDLYLAQGFVTARDRLWQMDIQTRQAAGRLSEIVGPKALEIDRFHRRTGMVYGAENSLRAAMRDPQVKLAMEAYSQGVNSYIHRLTPRDYPIEFKLLDYAPEEFKPINCIYLLKLMAETLAGRTDAVQMTNVLNKFGPAVTRDLFPDYPFREDPIIPAGTKWNFTPLKTPQPSASFLASQSGLPANNKPEGIGSNNWVIAGSKTASGYPILANDPHLNLTYPSIWYQIQLSAPGVNTYGVSIPGAPCIIIGYNERISWGVTNVDADVYDWYQIKFKDNTHQEYWYNNQWNKVKPRLERINVRGQAAVIDTVFYTHHGPVTFEEPEKKPSGKNKPVPVAHALRWLAHDESDELKTFYLLNRGKNYGDYRQALTYYSCPAQNFIFAAADKDIALTPNGKYPLKYRDQGKFILNGADPGDDWHGWIPNDQNPTVKNPARGYLSSANQSSTDPTYPYYLNWQFAPYERAHRINTRLAAMQKATVDSMRNLQTDNYSIFAHDVMAEMLKNIDITKLDENQLEAVKLLEKWDLRYDENSVGASIFDTWWKNFYDMIWQDNFGKPEDNLKLPSRDRTVQLMLQEPQSKWFDNLETPVVETCADLLSQSFAKTVSQLHKKYGKPGTEWEWGNVKETYLNHLANIPGMGVGKYKAGGTSTTVNALIGGHGPSWRMVVQLGPKVKGYGVFPGGESGNPGSYFYDNMFNTWRKGQLNELLFLQSANESSSRIKSTLTLKTK